MRAGWVGGWSESVVYISTSDSKSVFSPGIQQQQRGGRERRHVPPAHVQRLGVQEPVLGVQGALAFGERLHRLAEVVDDRRHTLVHAAQHPAPGFYGADPAHVKVLPDAPAAVPAVVADVDQHLRALERLPAGHLRDDAVVADIHAVQHAAQSNRGVRLARKLRIETLESQRPVDGAVQPAQHPGKRVVLAHRHRVGFIEAAGDALSVPANRRVAGTLIQTGQRRARHFW